MFKLSNGSHSQLRKMPAMAMCRCPLSTSADFGHRSPFYILLSVRLGKIKYGACFAPFQKLVLFMSHFHIIAAEFLILNKDYIIWSTSWFPDFFWCNQWKLVAWWRVWRFKKSEIFLKMWKPDTHLAFREVFGDNRKFPLRQSFNYQSHGENPFLTNSRRTTNYAPLPSMTLQIRWCLFGIRIQCVDNLKTCLNQTSSEVNWKIVWWWTGIYPYVPIHR